MKRAVEHCATKGCREQAKHMVVIVMPPPRGSHPNPEAVAITAYVRSLVLCEKHREVTTDDVISDEGWRRLVTGLRAIGRIVPRREDARVELVPLAYGIHEYNRTTGGKAS